MAKRKAGCGLSGRAPRAHRFDESAAGYSLAGWSPPEPASASPADLIMPRFGWIRYAFSVNRNTSLISWPRLRGPLQSPPDLPPDLRRCSAPTRDLPTRGNTARKPRSRDRLSAQPVISSTRARESNTQSVRPSARKRGSRWRFSSPAAANSSGRWPAVTMRPLTPN